MNAQDLINKLHGDPDLCISIILTEQCNFQCRHCCFDSGSHKPAGYVSNDVLERIRDMSMILGEYGIYVDYNLIGGEPTLNMREFRRCLGMLVDYPDAPDRCSVVTNGWWFSHPYWRYKFFDAVAGYVVDVEGLRITVSNDEFHDEWRKYKLVDLKAFLGDLDGFTGICRCGYWGYGNDDGSTEICPDCGEELLRVPENDTRDPWIYIASRSNVVYPIGRGQLHGNMDRSWIKGDCTTGNNLVFHTDGSLSDICCIGTGQNFGTVWDHPLSLLGVGHTFVRDKNPICWDCEEMAEEWIESGLKEARDYWMNVDWEEEYGKNHKEPEWDGQPSVCAA